MAAGDKIQTDSALSNATTITDLWALNSNPLYFTGNRVRLVIYSTILSSGIYLEEYITGSASDGVVTRAFGDPYGGDLIWNVQAEYSGSWRLRRHSGTATPKVYFKRFKRYGVAGRKLKYFYPYNYDYDRSLYYNTVPGSEAGVKITWASHAERILTPS